MIRRIGVVIPARDESATIAQCLRSVEVAAARLDIPVSIVTEPVVFSPRAAAALPQIGLNSGPLGMGADSLSAAQRDAWSAQALELLDRSLAANPDDVEAAWSFGVLSARLKRDPDLALQRLQRASTLMPENADLARAKFEVTETSGRSGQNLHLLKQIAAFASSTAERQWAKQRIASETAGPQTPPTN